MRASLVAPWVLLLATSCRNDPQVVDLDYVVSEYPRSASDKVPIGCIPQGQTDGPGATAIRWSVGSSLTVSFAPSFDRTCGLYSPDCSPEQIVDTPLDANVWTVALGPEPGWFSPNQRYLEAIAPGQGGISAEAGERPLPSLELQAIAPTGFRFYQQATGNFAVPLEPIAGHLVAAKGEKITVKAELLSDTGPLCGFPQMQLSATGPSVAWSEGLQAFEGRANTLFEVTGGDPGKIEVSAAGATGTLFVDTQ